MDNDQLLELAHNARINHWPPHLGVVTDGDKADYLAKAIEASTTNYDHLEVDQAGTESENEELQAKVDDLTEKNDKLEAEIAELKYKLDQIRSLTL